MSHVCISLIILPLNLVKINVSSKSCQRFNSIQFNNSPIPHLINCKTCFCPMTPYNVCVIMSGVESWKWKIQYPNLHLNSTEWMLCWVKRKPSVPHCASFHQLWNKSSTDGLANVPCAIFQWHICSTFAYYGFNI